MREAQMKHDPPRGDNGQVAIKWQGRKPKGEQCTHSFEQFKRTASLTATGRAHLRIHHGIEV